MSQEKFINFLLEDGKNIAKNVEEKFLRLTFDQLNKKSAPESWSAEECFKHLLDTNKYYIEKAEELFPGSPKINEGKKFKHSFMGKFIIKSVSPQNKSKYKTAKEFNPINSNIDPNIVQEFLDQNKQVLEKIDNARGIDLAKIKVLSPFASFIKYNFGDAFKMVIEHNKRHINQAERAAKS